MLRLFFVFMLVFYFSYGEEGLVVESKIIKQEYNKEELNRIKSRLAEIEKNQKYILETLSHNQKSQPYPYQTSSQLEQKIEDLAKMQNQIYAKLSSLERYTKKQLFIQTLIQFIIFAIFFIFIFLLYRYKKDTTTIENKIDDVSSKIDTNKKETIKILMEKAKEDPKIAAALKSLIDEEKSPK